MPRISEKEILKSIKQSVEVETPDVWEKIKSSEKYKYDFHKKALNSKVRRAYLPVAAAVLCVMVAAAGFKMNIFNLQGKSNEFIAIAPGIAEDSSGREIAPVAPDIFRPFTKDADVNEAAKAFNIDIAVPTWMPEGFTKNSSKLFSSNEDGSKPYMYNIEYSGSGKKMLTVSITKYMTEDEKLKAQAAPMPMPMPEEKGAAVDLPTLPPDAPTQSSPAYNPTGQAAPPNTAVDLPSLPPNAPAQSTPGYNPSAPAAPPVGKPTPQDGVIGGGTNGNTGSGVTTPSSEPISVEVTRVKIKGIDVNLTIMSSNESGTVAAYWVYNGGNYNIYTDGISKSDMIKIIESMIK
jgi:hypothetical protein